MKAIWKTERQVDESGRNVTVIIPVKLSVAQLALVYTTRVHMVLIRALMDMVLIQALMGQINFKCGCLIVVLYNIANVEIGVRFPAPAPKTRVVLA